MNNEDINSSTRNSAEQLCELIPDTHLNFWQTPGVSAQQVTLSVPDKCIDEIRSALAGSSEQHTITENTEGFVACREFACEVTSYLSHNGPGVVIIDRFPAEDYDEFNNKRMCSLFSSLVGSLMEQNHAGVTLYDVKNTNPKDPSKVRKSITNHAQPFHTDGGWHTLPAKYVGLYCVRNAKEGGGSMVTSLMAAYRELLSAPQLADKLLQSVAWDKQGEHAIDDCPFEMNSVIEACSGEFLARYYESYIRNGMQKKDAAITPQYEEALQAFGQAILNQPALEFEMKTGQFQYLNNWTVAHARNAFTGAEDTPLEHTRHVIRVWNH